MKVHVNLGENSYDVLIEQGVAKRAQEELNLNRKVLVVTDKGVPAEYAKNIAAKCKNAVIGTIEGGEDYKSLATMEKLFQLMLDNNFTRKDCVVAVGGGVVGDLAGFVAASYMRGVDFYNIPTTVLSCVDSSVGGKTAVNFGGVKNIIGAFWQPKKVLIDVDLLKTLPARQISNGLAEALKMGMTFDKNVVELFKKENPLEHLEEIISKSVQLKADVVEKDEKEAGLRRVLNFGHTLGHGIETNCDGKFYHGECVAMGMVAMCSDEVREELIPILKKLNLPVSCKIDLEKALDAVSHDKKSDAKGIHAILVNEMGTFVQQEMTLAELKKRLALVVEE